VTAAPDIVPAVLDRIRHSLIGLRMPRAMEVLDHTVRQLECGQVSALEAIDTLLAEELTLRESRRIRTALVMARLTAVKTLAGFDFSFQPSLDRGRILALAQLAFIDRNEVVHVLGPPGTGKSHLATALGVAAVKAGRSVYFSTLADIIASLAKAEREGCLRERIRWLARSALLIVDEIGPPGAQQVEQMGGEHDVAVLASLALLNADQHPLAVDVADLQAGGLGGAQPGAVGDAQRRPILQPGGRPQQPRHLVRAQHHRQPLRLAKERHLLDHLAPAERHLVEEPQGRDGGVDAGDRRAAGRQVKVPAAQILGAGPGRQRAEEVGEGLDGRM
jgi:hypothetical protein